MPGMMSKIIIHRGKCKRSSGGGGNIAGSGSGDSD